MLRVVLYKNTAGKALWFLLEEVGDCRLQMHRERMSGLRIPAVYSYKYIVKIDNSGKFQKREAKLRLKDFFFELTFFLSISRIGVKRSYFK